MKSVQGLDCILLIDDDESTNFLNEMIIRETGIQTHVQSVMSGKEGLDYLTCQGDFAHNKNYPQPGIIFLDINMPAMNGWEFLQAYESLPENQKARLVVAMLTTSLNPDDQERGTQNKDVKTFCHKPLTISMVLDLVDQYFIKEHAE